MAPDFFMVPAFVFHGGIVELVLSEVEASLTIPRKTFI